MGIEHLLLIKHEKEKQLLVHFKDINGKEVSINKLQYTMFEKEKLINLQTEELNGKRRSGQLCSKNAKSS